jgi:serine/threonine-protein kinase RsbW
MMTVDCDVLGETSTGPLPPADSKVCYRESALCRAEEVVPLLDDLVAAMAGLGYPPRDGQAVRLALEEAVVNGVRHGNGGDPARRVLVRCWVRPDAVLAEVEDEGPGFDPSLVPDPTLPENMDRPSGRGLLLMRHFMTWVRFCGRGNCVMLYKRRSV